MQLNRNACKRIGITRKLLVKLSSLPPIGQPLTKPHNQTIPHSRRTHIGIITNPLTPLPTSLGRHHHPQPGLHLSTPHHSPITHTTLTPPLLPLPIPFPLFPLPTLNPMMIKLGLQKNGQFGNQKTDTPLLLMRRGTRAPPGAMFHPSLPLQAILKTKLHIWMIASRI